MPVLAMSLSGKTEKGMQSLAGEKAFNSSLKDVFWIEGHQIFFFFLRQKNEKT